MSESFHIKICLSLVATIRLSLVVLLSLNFAYLNSIFAISCWTKAFGSTQSIQGRGLSSSFKLWSYKDCLLTIVFRSIMYVLNVISNNELSLVVSMSMIESPQKVGIRFFAIFWVSWKNLSSPLSDPTTKELLSAVYNLLKPTSVLYSFLLTKNCFIQGSILYIELWSIAMNSGLFSNSLFLSPISLSYFIYYFKSNWNSLTTFILEVSH